MKDRIRQDREGIIAFLAAIPCLLIRRMAVKDVVFTSAPGAARCSAVMQGKFFKVRNAIALPVLS